LMRIAETTNNPQIKPVARTILEYLGSVSSAVNQIEGPDGKPVQIPDYEVLQRAASGLDIVKHPADMALVIQILLARGLSYDMDAPGPDYKLSFPKDHHLHPKMGGEWYYLSGNLKTRGPDGEAQRIGVMIWIQKNRMVGNTAQADAGWTDDESTIVSSQATVVMETDDGRGRIYRRSRNVQWPLKGGSFSYSRPGEDFSFTCGPDSFAGSKNVLPMHAKVDDGANLTLDLTATCLEEVTPKTAFFLRGDNGTGLTAAPSPGIVYGWPQVKVSGSVTAGGKTYVVESGTGWIDHQLLMYSLQPPPIPYLTDPRPYVGWCWFYFNLENKETFTFIGINLFGLNPQLAIAPNTGWYVSPKDGRWNVTILDGTAGMLTLMKFLSLPAVTSRPGPNRVNLLMPNAWAIDKLTSTSWPTPLSGAVKAWTEDATFNFQDWSLVSEAPADYKDTTGKFADGTGYAEVIGYENVISYRNRAVAFLETGILPGRPVGATGFVAASLKKPLVIKLGRRSRSDIAELRKHRSGAIMDQISDIVKKLETEGRLDRDAKIAVALVH
jgi:predicted secreted hydrolase